VAEEAWQIRAMDRNTAETLIKQYFQSWLQQDLSLFLSTLSQNSKVVECYGPVYCGTEELRQWFVHWHTGGGKGKVTKWEIFNILYDEAQERAAVEWDFECIYEGTAGSFLGASLFRFDETKIEHIQEYKMEKKQYRPYGE
jgi:hypothetical protein